MCIYMSIDQRLEESFEGLPLKRGDQVKITKPVLQVATLKIKDASYGPKLYEFQMLTADYVLKNPDGTLLVSCKLTNSNDNFFIPIYQLESA
jgi:hypothetical protein